MNFIISKFKQRDIWSSYLLYALYFLLGMYYPLYSFMRQTFPDHMMIVVYYNHILLLLLLLKIVLQKNSIFDWLLVLALLYLCRKSYQYNYDFYNIFGTLMLMCCAKNIDIKKIIKADLSLRVVRSILFLALPYLGLMVNNIHYYVGGRERTFFGWTHPNMMGLDFLLLAIDIMYLRKECKKWYDCILYAGIIIFLDKTANSRTAEAVIAILIIVQLLSILMSQTWFHRMMVLFTSGALFLCIGIPFIGTYLYIHNPDLFSGYEYSTMLSRIQLTVNFYHQNGGLAFYGFPVEDTDCLDMMFSYIPLHWGLAAFIIIAAALIFTIIAAAVKKNTSLLALLFLFLIYGCSEVAHVYPVYSYFAILFGYYVMNHKTFFSSTWIEKWKTKIVSPKENGDA